jgi:hypothetical protein
MGSQSPVATSTSSTHQNVAADTLSKYSGPFRDFVQWCQTRGERALAASPTLVCLYFTKLRMEGEVEGMGPSRVLTAAAAISHYFGTQGKEACRLANTDLTGVGYHSLRKGGCAAAAATHCVPDRLLMSHGRWRSRTALREVYAVPDLLSQLMPSQHVGLGSPLLQPATIAGDGEPPIISSASRGDAAVAGNTS